MSTVQGDVGGGAVLVLSGGAMTGPIAMGNNNVTGVKQVTFNSVPTAAKSGASPALVDWTAGSFQEIVIGNITGTPTFTAPTGPSRLTLRVKQDATGSRTIAAWPSGVRWPGATAPTLSTAANAIDYVTFLYDGTNYDGYAAAGSGGAWA